MKERLFNSMTSDAARVHRMPYQKDCGAIHAMGSGEIMLYGRGPEWVQVVGAPYSCPTAFSLVVPSGEDVQSRSVRRPSSGGWTHHLPQGTLEDCADRASGCLLRRWSLSAPVRFELDAHGFALRDCSALFPEADGAWLICVPANAAVYNDYPLMNQSYMLVAVRGGCSAAPSQEGLLLTLDAEGALYAAGSQDYPECIRTLREILARPAQQIIARADADDAAFLERCAEHRAPLRDHPLRGRVLEAVEAAALMIRAQQHRGGGVLAGHNYHLAYVRDQYGTSRGLLAAGAVEEAKRILGFYRETFARWGKICNAQTMGREGAFHVHENDEVEITGYLLLQAADCLEATGDADFFRSLMPMLRWALQAQLKWLHGGMLPFNGDETYVAGGLVPRTMLNHGSFEATLLLIEGGTRFMDLCAAMDAQEEWMEEARLRIRGAKEAFGRNFRRGSHYVTNSLLRTRHLTEPEFRHGVCCGCGAFGWTFRTGEGAYQCIGCAGTRNVAPCREEYSLKSTLLMAPFIHSGMPDGAFLKERTQEYLAAYRATGVLPSHPSGDVCLGYDFGLMLFAAAQADLDAGDLLEHMLALQDECGAWSEYYEGGAPRQTRCRPWESGINIAGAMRWLTQK